MRDPVKTWLKYNEELYHILLIILGVLTGELSGLVQGGSPTNVTLLPNITEPGFTPSFLNKSDLQTNAKAQTIFTTKKIQ